MNIRGKIKLLSPIPLIMALLPTVPLLPKGYGITLVVFLTMTLVHYTSFIKNMCCHSLLFKFNTGINIDVAIKSASTFYSVYYAICYIIPICMVLEFGVPFYKYMLIFIGWLIYQQIQLLYVLNNFYENRVAIEEKLRNRNP